MPNLLNWFAQQIAAALSREMGPKWDIVGQGEISGIVGLENYQWDLKQKCLIHFVHIDRNILEFCIGDHRW